MPGPGRPPIDSQARRALLIDCTAELMQQGIDTFRMDDVAAAAGLSKVLIYRQFASRKALVTAALEEGLARFMAALECAQELSIVLGRVLSSARVAPHLFTVLLRTSSGHNRYGAASAAALDRTIALLLWPLELTPETAPEFALRSGRAMAGMLHDTLLDEALDEAGDDQRFIAWAEALVTGWLGATAKALGHQATP